MATDDERREVAERLRDVARTERGALGEIGFTEAMHRALGGDDWRDMTGRLADLIDPDCGTGEAPASRVDGRDGTRERLARALGIDLPALLALAEELDSWARDRGDGYEPVLWRAGCVAYARRIREACGEAVRADGL